MGMISSCVHGSATYDSSAWREGMDVEVLLFLRSGHYSVASLMPGDVVWYRWADGGLHTVMWVYLTACGCHLRRGVLTTGKNEDGEIIRDGGCSTVELAPFLPAVFIPSEGCRVIVPFGWVPHHGEDGEDQRAAAAVFDA